TKSEIGGNFMKKMFALTSLMFCLLLFLGFQAAPSRRIAQNPIERMIKAMEAGRPVHQGNLTVIPLYLSQVANKTEFITLDEAIDKNWIDITEMDGGRVPEVRISNRSKHIIYLMGGEILTGCKQDRILAGDVLLGPGTTDLIAPVFCVEHGRWTQQTSSFYSKKNIGTYALRSIAQQKSQSAQSAIWDHISEKNGEMAVTSATGAYQDAYEAEENKDKIQAIEKEMISIPSLNDDTVGVLIALGSRIVSADVFANPALFKKQWPKILRASALSSISSRDEGTIGRKEAVDFFNMFRGSSFRTKQGLDLGTEMEGSTETATIHALVSNNDVLHLAAFPKEKDRIKIFQDSSEQIRRMIRNAPQIQQQALPSTKIRDNS
ncbi:MAG: hypothetical protein MUP70_02875, partial [Candidatus Aminicenantes bacterium]|nr:hypothetical protein [Candidatus Aminicenantes bacterium]